MCKPILVFSFGPKLNNIKIVSLIKAEFVRTSFSVLVSNKYREGLLPVAQRKRIVFII